MKKKIAALLCMFMMFGQGGFLPAVQATEENVVFELDFETEGASTATLNSSMTAQQIYDVTNTWIDLSVYNQDKIKAQNPSGGVPDSGKSYRLVEDVYERMGRVLEIKGYDTGVASGNDGNHLAILNVGQINKSYPGAASMDCGANGSFRISFDFATSNLDVKLALCTSRMLGMENDTLNEDVSAFGKELFVLNSDGSISIFGNTVSIAEIGEIKAGEWHHAEIVFNASNQMGLKVDGKVVRQMAEMSGNYAGSLRGLANKFYIPINVGISADSDRESSTRYLDNIKYSFSKTDAALTLEDDPPPEEEPITVSLRGIYGSAEFSANEEKVIEVAVSEPESISSVALYVDGSLYDSCSTAPFLFDLENCGVGEYQVYAVATATDGRTATSDVAVIKISLLSANELWKVDFENYSTGDTAVGDYIELYPRRGYFAANSVDDTYQNSLLVGMGETANAGDTGALMLINNRTYQSHRLQLEMDIYPAEVGGNNSLALLQSGIPNVSILNIGTSEISSPLGGSKTYDDAEWKKSQWIHLRVDINIPEHRVSIYLKPENATEEYLLVRNASIREDMTTLKEIRLFGPSEAGASALLVDNVTLSLMEEYSIQKIEADKMDGEKIDYNCSELKVFLNGTVQKDAVKAEDFRITNENGEAAILEAVYDNSQNCILLRLGSKLDFDSIYTLEISEHFITGNSQELGKAMTKTFQTSLPDLGVTPKGMSGEMLTVAVKNQTDAPKTVYVVAGVYDGNRFISMTVEEITAPNDTETDYTVTVDKVSEGDNIRVFVWDSLLTPQMLTRNVAVYH